MIREFIKWQKLYLGTCNWTSCYRRGSVKRISELIYEETRNVLTLFLKNFVKDAITYTEYTRRKNVTTMDVIYAFKRQGRALYGF